MKRLLIDLDICSKCEECSSVCSYIQHPSNNGITSLREFAHFAAVCRRCDDAPCVQSCPWEALEKQDDKVLIRYMMRCTSCKSCSSGCPFGTIIPETIPFLVTRCDFCLGRIGPDKAPICLESCTYGGIKYGEYEENIEEDIYKISEYLTIKTGYKWERNGEVPAKKK